jgi:hypothetical protein
MNWYNFTKTGKEVHPIKGDEHAAKLYNIAADAEAKWVRANAILKTKLNSDNLKRANRLAVAAKKAAANYQTWIERTAD